MSRLEHTEKLNAARGVKNETFRKARDRENIKDYIKRRNMPRIDITFTSRKQKKKKKRKNIKKKGKTR